MCGIGGIKGTDIPAPAHAPEGCRTKRLEQSTGSWPPAQGSQAGQGTQNESTTVVATGHARLTCEDQPTHAFSSLPGDRRAVCPTLASGYGKAWVISRPTHLKANALPALPSPPEGLEALC